MSACEEVPSLYGTAGWTVESGIHDLLKEYLSPFGDLSFTRFTDIDAETLATLVTLLPAANMDDCQNRAPALRELCAAALARPKQVTLSGYIVGPPRHDERVSIDGLMVVGTPITVKNGWGQEPLGEERLQLWRHLGEYLGFAAHLGNCPDEMVPLREVGEGDGIPIHGRQGWWLWWD